MCMKTVKILIDCNEKAPLPFSTFLPMLKSGGGMESVRIVTETRRLKTADYQLEGSDVCFVERKGGLGELASNLVGSRHERDRVRTALDRLAGECQVPVLVVEGSLLDFTKPEKWVRNPAGVMDLVIEEVLSRGILFFCSPGPTIMSRRAIGDWVARVLIGADRMAKQGRLVVPSGDFLNGTDSGSIATSDGGEPGGGRGDGGHPLGHDGGGCDQPKPV